MSTYCKLFGVAKSLLKICLFKLSGLNIKLPFELSKLRPNTINLKHKFDLYGDEMYK